MLHLLCRIVGSFIFLVLFVSVVANTSLAQFETATVSGQVVDPSGLGITRARVRLIDIDRDTTTSAATNPSGLYTFPSVRPGRYRMEVTATGFKVVNITGLTVNVQDHLEQNFKLAIGSVSESVTVEAGSTSVDTESASVSTVVDRNFAENLPMNGRSFQTLIDLTPGVVLTPSTSYDGGQFSVNGQRAVSNYWMVDGVSANIGVSSGFNPGNGFAGTLGGFGAQGGTNGLVSVDAMQEFRIQTSTYAPEFGRTPGGQISIVTRSGTNGFHGSLFDYFRNDVLDANDWFNGYTNTPPLPKAEERQNDFGGTLSGPIQKDRTFFFFSYEGLRLRLPQTELTTVPDVAARQEALPAVQPFLNAYPLPTAGTPDDVAQGIGQFNKTFSNSSTLDAYSIRIDHRLTDKLSVFGRYNYSPSQIVQRPSALSVISTSDITIHTATVGATWVISPGMVNDARFNYSRTSAGGHNVLDNFGGAVPLNSLPFPAPYTSRNAQFALDILSLQQGTLFVGQTVRNLQEQINLVDNVTLQRGTHSLKFGADFRRLAPQFEPYLYGQNADFSDVPSAANGNVADTFVQSLLRVPFLFRNLGIFAQDSWRVVPRLTLTYGLRWDVDFAPSTSSGPGLPAATGFNISNLTNLGLAPPGTPAFHTPYHAVAPRLGLTYRLLQSSDWVTVLRGGAGVFFDLVGGEVGNTFLNTNYPFGQGVGCPGAPVCPAGAITFPLDAAVAAPPPIVPPNSTSGTLGAFDPNIKLPYTVEWNLALEQALGQDQTISASYIGAAGKRLIQSALILQPNSNLLFANLIGNFSTSDYNALQIQFHRHLSHGLQALASYTWSHSLDTASSGSYFNGSNAFVASQARNANRGPSVFDIRNALSGAITYDLPAANVNAFTNAIFKGWSTENIIQARSSPPVDVYNSQAFFFLNGYYTNVRPDAVPGQPLYLYGPMYPGGLAFNPAAFTNPPTDPNTGAPLRQGDLPRNALRGFGGVQWDFSVHRDFSIHESLRLQFRAELFNILNHPNFGSPVGDLSSPQFGRATQTLGQYLSGGNVGGGGFSPLYQLGGPRSIQFALKLDF